MYAVSRYETANQFWTETPSNTEGARVAGEIKSATAYLCDSTATGTMYSGSFVAGAPCTMV
jgi:hypothetical protein